MKRTIYYVFDFDSTLTQVEALDELGAICLAKNKEKQQVVDRIKTITELGMEGKISIQDSLSKRLSLLSANKKHIPLLIKRLKKKISPSFKRNKSFFKKYHKNVLVISNGFKEFIVPVVQELGISPKLVYANTFTFDKEGNIQGFDQTNLLSQQRGKAKLLKSLKLKGEVVVIGDGYTDYEMKKEGVAHKFVAFTETASRDVSKIADNVVGSFDEFLYTYRLPMRISYPKSKIKVLLLEKVHKKAVDRFSKEGYKVEVIPKSLSEQELAEKLHDVSILGIRSKTGITQTALAHAHRLLAIGVFGVGTNHVNLDGCLEKGVGIFNAPYSNTRSVVELVIADIIMLMRGIGMRNNLLHQGKWEKSAKGCHEIRGKKLGIIGYGNIGSQVSVLAESLGMEVYYYDIVEKLAMGNVKRCNTLKELLRTCDVITLHVDANRKIKPIIGEKEFKSMKQGAFFINVSRGFLVDLKALKKSIENGTLGGAALDVYPDEPRSSSALFSSGLEGLPNVVLTPHIGGSTQEAQENIAQYVSENIISFVNTGDSFAGVNLPKIKLQEVKNAHRFIHIHRDVPGVLAAINNILSSHKINIVGQHLKTNGHIGYVITDVAKTYNKEVIGQLKQIKHTLRFRVLY